MATFSYRARNATGEVVRGTLVADTTAAAARMLAERSLMPVELDQVEAAQKSLLTGKARRVKLAKVGMMYEQLADLLRAGVPLLRALTVLSSQSSSPALARVLREVYESVSGGDSLADAMARHPHAFPELHASMVRAGEKGGFLEDVLTRLSDFVARQDALRNKFIGAMIYPCILFVGATGAVIFIMAFVVPKIRPVLEGQVLPLPTRIVFALCDLLQYHYVSALAVLLLGTIVLVGYFQTQAGKQVKNRLQLRAPGIGKIYTMVRCAASAASSVLCWPMVFPFCSRCASPKTRLAMPSWRKLWRRRPRMCATANLWQRPWQPARYSRPSLWI